MKHLFSWPLARSPQWEYRNILGALLCMVVLGFGAVSFAPPAYAATSGETIPALPHGFKLAASPNLSQLYGKDPAIHMEILTLSSASCAALNQASPAAAPTCQLRHYWNGTTHLALPQGTNKAASVASGYWYWWAWDQLCSANDPGTHDGCRYWSFTMTEDGVANGHNVWQWNHGCTAGGFFGSVDGQWCGYLYNGGGWPHYAMQFGLNGRACLITAWGTGCYNHGMRRWINDWGNLSTFYSW